MAPFAAARPNKFSYYGYSLFVNVLDYTSVVVPVTRCDKNVDKVVNGFQGVDEDDQQNQDNCEQNFAVRVGSAALTTFR